MATSSSIVATVPVDNVKVQKSDMRANFLAAKNEINQLFKETSLGWLMAIGSISTKTL
jgi:hypothetical protein